MPPCAPTALPGSVSINWMRAVPAELKSPSSAAYTPLR